MRLLFVLICILCVNANYNSKEIENVSVLISPSETLFSTADSSASFDPACFDSAVKVNIPVIKEVKYIGCTCGIFLSSQFIKENKEQPKGKAVRLHEFPDRFPCNAFGNKMCTNKCLDVIIKYLPNSPAILCGAIDRDCYKERAYLFIKNCKDEWINTNHSAGREYCCKDGIPFKCPIMSL